MRSNECRTRPNSYARAGVGQEPHGGVERERGGHLRRPRPRRVAGAGLEVAEFDGAAAAVVARGVAHRVD